MNYYSLINSMSKEGAPTPLFLDIYTGASVAYSIHKLSNSALKCIRVRRSSDNTELDIGFFGLIIDIASLLSFVGAGNGFLVKKYDQTGNGVDSHQTNTSLQPLVVVSGAALYLNSHPYFHFNSKFMPFPAITLNSDFSVFSVGSPDIAQIFVPVAGAEAPPVSALMRFTDNKYYFIKGNKYALSTAADTSIAQMMISGIVNSGTMTIYKNGYVESSSGATGSYGNTLSQVGKYSSSNVGSCLFQELVVYNFSQNTNQAAMHTAIKSRFPSLP